MKTKSSDGPGRSQGSASGFSLIELLVVMLVTFFVSGAIYALLASGQNSFRREPEIADRQQNIRVAMDVITQDVVNAGTNLPAFVQVFTASDPGGAPVLDGAGPVGSIGNAALSLNSDVLEIIAAEDRCPGSTVCTGVVSGVPGVFAMKEKNPACLTAPGLAVATDNNFMTIQPIVNVTPVACPVGGLAANNGGVSLGAAVAIGSNLAANPVAPVLTAPAPGNSIYAFLFPARVSRYVIGYDPADTDQVPLLFRSVTGRYLVSPGGAVSVPNAPSPVFAGAAVPGANWQVVARGIEDLQVEYQNGLGAWSNSPPAAVPCAPPGIVGGCATQAAFDAIVRQVRITLSARVVAQGLQGSITAAGAGAPNRIRGQLVTIIQPRAAMTSLEMANEVR